MTNETIDKLVVDLELSANEFDRQAGDAEQRYEDLSKNLDKTSNKIKSKSKKTKKDLSGITKETKEAGNAFKSSGKATQNFFSPLTKGTLAFAAAAFTLKSIADGLANVAQRLADVNTLSKETGVGVDVLTARANTEEYFNIQKGTFANAAQAAASEKGRWQSGQGISKEYQSALTRLDVAWNPNDINAMLEQAIKNANEKYTDIATRNQALAPLQLYGYGTNNFNDVQRKFNENRDIERRRSGNYEESDKYRKEYIQATQELSRAFTDLAVALMPLVTTIIEGLIPLVKTLKNPAEAVRSDFTSKKEAASARARRFAEGKDFESDANDTYSKIQVVLLKREKEKQTKQLANKNFNANSLASPNTINNVNTQTNNITNNVRITTNDPARTIQNLSTKGIQQKNLTSNYMSAR